MSCLGNEPTVATMFLTLIFCFLSVCPFGTPIVGRWTSDDINVLALLFPPNLLITHTPTANILGFQCFEGKGRLHQELLGAACGRAASSIRMPHAGDPRALPDVRQCNHLVGVQGQTVAPARMNTLCI